MNSTHQRVSPSEAFAKSIVDQVLEYICYDSNFEVNVFAYFISQSGCLWEDVSLIISEDRHDFVRFDTFVNYLEGRSSSKTSIKRFSAIASTIGLILCQRYCGPCLKHPFSMIWDIFVLLSQTIYVKVDYAPTKDHQRMSNTQKSTEPRTHLFRRYCFEQRSNWKVAYTLNKAMQTNAKDGIFNQ